MYQSHASAGGAEQTIIPMLAILVAVGALVICVFSVPYVRHALAERLASARSHLTPHTAPEEELAVEPAAPIDRERAAFDMSIFDLPEDDLPDP